MFKRLVFFLLAGCVVITFLVSRGLTQSREKIPKGIAGFELNRDISEYSEKIILNRSFVSVDYPYLTAYEILPFPGFRGGFLVVGNCTGSRRILRIKLKYSNGSRKFFRLLKNNIVRRFGKPVEYRGDPFHVFVAWKWRFVTKDGKVVSLILQHYSGSDEEYASGNSIKLNFISAIKHERECYKKNKEKFLSRKNVKKSAPPEDINYYLPY